MRAAYDSSRHDDRLGTMVLNEPEDVVCNRRIGSDVALLGEPTLQCTGLGPSAFNIATNALLALLSPGP
jgi:hypothetical protein